eukprot:145441_1
MCRFDCRICEEISVVDDRLLLNECFFCLLFIFLNSEKLVQFVLFHGLEIFDCELWNIIGVVSNDFFTESFQNLWQFFGHSYLFCRIDFVSHYSLNRLMLKIREKTLKKIGCILRQNTIPKIAVTYCNCN